jgi:hypothetical protein
MSYEKEDLYCECMALLGSKEFELEEEMNNKITAVNEWQCLEGGV